MPSATRGGRGRCAIPTWRVKAGKKDVFAGTKGQCTEYIRQHGKLDGVALRIVPPNK